MKHLITVVILTVCLSLLAFSGEKKEKSDKAFLWTVNGLSELSAGQCGQGVGAKYYSGGQYWLRASIGYNSSNESSQLTGSAGIFKGIYSTSNTDFSLGAELGSTGVEGDYNFGIIANVEYLAWDNVSFGIENGLFYHKSTSTWKTNTGGKLIMAWYF